MIRTCVDEKISSGVSPASVATYGGGRLGRIDRAAPHRHADQQDRHGPAGEEGELRIVPAAEGAGDAQAEQGDDEADLARDRPSADRGISRFRQSPMTPQTWNKTTSISKTAQRSRRDANMTIQAPSLVPAWDVLKR